jgi:hypothetical protein
MPLDIMTSDDIKIGDIYEDSFYHPCLCLHKEGMLISGVSLVDGSWPRAEDLGLSGVRILSFDEALVWKQQEPQDVVPDQQWIWW